MSVLWAKRGWTGKFTPARLFALSNTQGAWYDPSDFSTLFQNSTGTTPVTAVEQPVGLMLDRSGRGHHASQSSAASRPILRARYNLLERSQEFDNAWWTKLNVTVTANAAVAPDGTLTADLFFPTTTGTDRLVWRQPGISGAIGVSYTVSVIAKAAGKSFLYFSTLNGDTTAASIPFFDLTNGQVAQAGTHFNTVTIQALGDGWFRCVATRNAATSALQFPLYGVADASGSGTATTNGTDGILIWGASLLTAADQSATGGAYQRIGAATDYDTSNPVWRPYLAFDGSDDSMSTSSIDFSGTDEMTVFAGLTKLSDANPAVVVEFGIQSASSNGFGLFAPDNNAVARYGVECYGTARNSRLYETYAAPVTNVITAKLTTTAANSAAAMQIRINAAAVSGALNVENASTGNFSNKSLFIGRRNDTSVPFNGRLTSLIVLGRTATADEISVTEGWVNGKTGAY